MAAKSGLTGIDPDSWRVTILPLPKRSSRGTATGFCHGQAVGRAETAQGKTLACWWPDARPELLGIEGQKSPNTGIAGGEVIPGSSRNSSGSLRAVAWRFHDGKLHGSSLHHADYDETWCTATGGGVIVGMGTPPLMLKRRSPDVGLVWRDGAQPSVLSANGGVALQATDGTRVAGAVEGRAAFWPSIDESPIDLAPEGMSMSEVEALDGELQVGLAFKGMSARACLWRGSAESFVDLTPENFDTGRAFSSARGFQAGFVRAKDTTANGSAALDNRAVLWQGAADRWLDLNELLPSADYNASVAWAIDISDGVVQVCGQASRYEVNQPGTPQESHAEPVAHPVIWTARLTG